MKFRCVEFGMVLFSHLRLLKLSVAFLLYCLTTGNGLLCAQIEPDSTFRAALSKYFTNYKVKNFRPMHAAKLEKCIIDDTLKTIRIYGNDTFGFQPFSNQRVDSVYSEISQLLPNQYKDYSVSVYGAGFSLEELVPNMYRAKADKHRMWGNINHKGAPWIRNTSLPYVPTQGLQNRYLTIWASHGRYYENVQNEWKWQRPYLFCSTEDLFTQTIVVPFLIPMLEKAGAVVYSPRERDWQTEELIVDNDSPKKDGTYTESQNGWENTFFPGFAHNKSIYNDHDNPFLDGSARCTKASRKGETACVWTPSIKKSGRYAVYISYQTYANSIPDAHYTITHRGVETHYLVNQKMGGGTWVYLGTFFFDANAPEKNKVTLTNQSTEKGIVTADAVRFGGGMGNTARKPLEDTTKVSGIVSNLPRYLEGARYYTQWAGFPYKVYSSKEGINDYADDINARSYSSNYLSGGSVFLPDTPGLKVPIELSLALHTDAGYCRNNEGYGTLGICTTTGNDGRTSFLNGVSRFASYDFAHFLTDEVTNNIQRAYGITWPRRELYNKNYSETRNPEVPSAILEMLAHQNFTDMRLGHDPKFKFRVARSIYKAILKYISFAHQTPCTVQPLPVKNFGMKITGKGKVTLCWQATTDTLESSSSPNAYVVYTARGNEGFDNGIRTTACNYTAELQPGIMYKFKITAVNEGGESFPSETLVARLGSKKAATLLIVNAFTRLAGPAFVNTADSLGFRLDLDPGVSYGNTPEYSGNQLQFNRENAGLEGPEGLGYSGSEKEGIMLHGNTFNYPSLHADALMSMPYTILSSSRGAVENGTVDLCDYRLVDIIFGLQKNAPNNFESYPTFSAALQQQTLKFLTAGGGLLVSGAYVASDMQASSQFVPKHLQCQYAGSLPINVSDTISSSSHTFTYSCSWGDTPYTVTSPDRLLPLAGAQTLYSYSDGSTAAIRFQKGKSRAVVMGFPFESIRETHSRNRAMQDIMTYLSSK